MQWTEFSGLNSLPLRGLYRNNARANMVLPSFVLYSFKITFSESFVGLPYHVKWHVNYVLRTFHWVGGNINQPILERDREGHQPYDRLQFLLHRKKHFEIFRSNCETSSDLCTTIKLVGYVPNLTQLRVNRCTKTKLVH